MISVSFKKKKLKNMQFNVKKNFFFFFFVVIKRKKLEISLPEMRKKIQVLLFEVNKTQSYCPKINKV